MDASQLTIRMDSNKKISAVDEHHDMLVFIILTHRVTPLTDGQCVLEFAFFLEYKVRDLLEQRVEETYKRRSHK